MAVAKWLVPCLSMPELQWILLKAASCDVVTIPLITEINEQGQHLTLKRSIFLCFLGSSLMDGFSGFWTGLHWIFYASCGQLVKLLDFEQIYGG
jgi:hypothetical protein